MSASDRWTLRHGPEGWRLRGPPQAGEVNRFLWRSELRGLTDGSMRTYAYDLLALLRWANGRPLQEMAEDDMLAFIAQCRHRIHPVTINRRIRLLDRYIRFFHPEPLAPLPPRRRKRLPLVRQPVSVQRPLNDEQVRKLWVALRTLRDQAIVALMWTSGLRIAEVLSLQLADVDLHTGSLRVHGKGGKQRLVPMAEWVGGLIRTYQLEERPRCATPQLFLVLKGHNRGRPMTIAGVRRVFRYWRARLDLPEAHPHRFRHTFAANMIRHGVTVPQLMRLLGHAWPTTTLRYVCFDDRQLRQDYEHALQQLRGPGRGL